MRLYLVDEDGNIQCWWKNFRDSMAGDFDSNRGWAVHRDKFLKENHRAELKAAIGSYISCLEFETEQDAVLFLLKWS